MWDTDEENACAAGWGPEQWSLGGKRGRYAKGVEDGRGQSREEGRQNGRLVNRNENMAAAEASILLSKSSQKQRERMTATEMSFSRSFLFGAAAAL